MFKLFQKNRGLSLDVPSVLLTKQAAQCREALTQAGVVWEDTEDGLRFRGKAFGAPMELEFRLHIEGKRVRFVEVSRQTALEPEEAFGEMSEILQKHFGRTIFASAAVTKALPSEQWYLPGMTVSHFLLDYKGLGEYLQVILK